MALRGDRASTSSSCYEDALDFSYLDLEQYAETLAGDIIEEATNTLNGNNGGTRDMVNIFQIFHFCCTSISYFSLI